jgi:AGZA family xanthine/uracil permease-like MFS transporter
MLLDTAGTLIGVARQAGLLDQDGRLPRLRQALLADSAGAMLGAALGTSTTTAYIESAAGVEVAAALGSPRSWWRCCFWRACSWRRSPRPCPLRHGTCAPLRRLPHGDEPRRDPMGRANRIHPALTIALMIPLSYSIATGIGLGFIAYAALKLLSGRVREINAASGTIAGAFLLKLIFA